MWLAVGSVMFTLIIVLLFAAIQTSAQQSKTDKILADLSLRSKAATEWFGLTQANMVRVTAVVITNDVAISTAFKDVILETTSKINELQKSIESTNESTNLNESEKKQMEKISIARKKVIALRDASRKLRADGKVDEALGMIYNEYIPEQKIYLQSLRDLVKIEEELVSSFAKEIEKSKDDTLQMVGAFILLLTLGVFIGAVFFIRSIQKPLEEANALASRIAQGDLSATVDTARGDEFGDLMRSLGAMNSSLGKMVAQVRYSTDSIATASHEIATGNNDLAHRTEQTSSNLQSTASGMAELTTIVQHSAENARQASALAINASAVAEKGGDVVQRVVSTMEEINTSSNKINDIISVIDGIAFQTNILALNAAVEAARAGEQGRGFAVVASEVRSLAQRSAEAAKEIKMLISTSVDKVTSGTQLVSAAGSTMNDIVQSVRKVSNVISEITAASAAQTSGIAQVNQAIGDLDQMTQQNAALVEESAAAAESLRVQAAQLVQAVAVFTVNGRPQIKM